MAADGSSTDVRPSSCTAASVMTVTRSGTSGRAPSSPGSHTITVSM